MRSEWTVVTSMSNMERKVLADCEPLALPTYLPQYLDLRGRPRIFFRNYVFVACPEYREHLLFRLKGSRGPILSNGKAARLPAGTIEQFRARENSRGYIDLEDDFELYAERFEPGQPLLVDAGAYRDKVVIYQGMDQDGRELALFTLLGREVVKAFRRSELTALTPSQ